ncbi:hypothetical protein JTB14_006327 [Gonioctena quinquepunctata]|nr:hypothetical protein JTB14_006327 [Gonioctena quinquepunctata]
MELTFNIATRFLWQYNSHLNGYPTENRWHSHRNKNTETLIRNKLTFTKNKLAREINECDKGTRRRNIANRDPCINNGSFLNAIIRLALIPVPSLLDFIPLSDLRAVRQIRVLPLRWTVRRGEKAYFLSGISLD